MRKFATRGLVVVVAAWLCACAAIYALMLQPPDSFARAMARIPAPVAFLAFPFETLWTHARRGHLEIGAPAPDFSLAKLDKSGSVQLSSFTSQHRPVVLIFGSYT